MAGKLGIENLKIAAEAAINFGMKIEKNLVDDGKISVAEALGIGAGSFGDIVKVIKSGTQIKAEFIDLDDDEREELIDYIEEKFDLENDKVEKVIEKSIEMLVGLDSLIVAIKDDEEE